MAIVRFWEGVDKDNANYSAAAAKLNLSHVQISGE